jgi:membrane-bound lytic murein transglycosylase B
VGFSRQRAVTVAALIAVGAVTVGLIDNDSSSLGSAAEARDAKSSSLGSAAEARDANAEELSAQLAANDLALRQAIDAWRAGDDPPKAPPPKEVMKSARYLQSVVRSLAAHKNLARNTVDLLPHPLASDIRVLTAAARDLRKLSAGWPPHNVRTGRPRPLAELARYYDAAFGRYGIHQHYLAAIHHVESKFGQVRNDSVAGAQGPMQFLPSTWDIYGGGGDIHDAHDAILAAARLLDDNGAPGDYGRALYAYNPSGLYVDAVQRYARLIKRDTYAIYFLYCWGP